MTQRTSELKKERTKKTKQDKRTKEGTIDRSDKRKEHAQKEVNKTRNNQINTKTK